MCFVDDDGVVLAEVSIVLQCGQQNAVSHDLDAGFGARFVGKPNLIANEPTELDTELFADAFGNGARGDSTRLGVGDAFLPQLKTHLRQLRCLARTSGTSHNHNLVGPNRLDDFVVKLADG